MAYRSEAGKIGNKINYKDLNMTHYPNALDSRTNNLNMKGFVNVGEESIPDYIMAEYVNSLLDSVMAIQRSLGVTPQVPINTAAQALNSTIETKTVSQRIGSIEGGLLDERYGGAGWRYIAGRPTLSTHNHDGLNGHPGKIHLQSEIEGLLNKQNLNITQASGLTAADLFVSKTNTLKVDAALNDMLSKKTGGSVLGKTGFKKGIRSRTIIELTAQECVYGGGATLTADTSATDSHAVQITATGAATLHNEVLGRDLAFGRYVLGARIKTQSTTGGNILRIEAGNKIETFNASEFESANKYKVFYVVFDHTSASSKLTISKLATAGVSTLQLDNLFVQPVHPAVFDR